MTGIKNTLQDAGWSIVGVMRSTADQWRYAANFATVPATATPAVKVPLDEPCDSPIHPMRHATLGFDDYLSYDEYRTIPPVCTGRVYYAAKPTTVLTAGSLMEAMMEANIFTVAMTEDGTRFLFHFTSTQPAWEFDLIPFQIGTGDLQMSGGYYLLRSQTTEDGGYLELKLQTQHVGHLGGGGTIITGIGPVTPYLTLTSSGGGHFEQPFYPGPVRYAMHANGYQFAIWPLEGTGREASALFASMLKPDNNHRDAANAVLVVASETDNFIDWQQLNQNLHWQSAYGTGYSSNFEIVKWGTFQESTGFWKNPTFMWRGFRGTPLLNEGQAAFAEAPYVLLSDDPNHQGKDRIGGRPWDMLLLSDGTREDGSIRHDGHTWRYFSYSTKPGDLTGSLWVLDEADE
jgi:hypothetical protein